MSVVQVDRVDGGGHMDFGVNTDSVPCVLFPLNSSPPRPQAQRVSRLLSKAGSLIPQSLK